MDLSEINHLANLSRLKLSPAEAENYAQKLTAIFEYVQKINQINTDHILPMAHAIPLALQFDHLRKDLGFEINSDQKNCFLNLSNQYIR